MYICRGCGNFMEENERVCRPAARRGARSRNRSRRPKRSRCMERFRARRTARRPVKRRQEGLRPQAPPVYGPYARPVPQAKTNGLAIAGLICSGLGLHTCGLTAVAGLILSLIALRQISERGERARASPSPGP